ncbi:Tyrosine-protein kinase ephrin type A/B receptor-like protein [Gracilaria domingensis]|nr:Tyrosine-protein kinase ephrin type A/B receptor-like protein [Gracilaria domingensis]
MCGACRDGQIVFANGTCADCPPGKQFRRATRSCESCQIGFLKIREGPGPCLPCPSGSFSISGATECFACPENQAPVMADGSCGKCSAGSFFQEFRLGCSECPPGTFTSVENVFNRCVPCERNTFALLPGASECFACPENQAPIMPDGSCGQCPPGSFLDDLSGSCVECFPGSFSNVPNVFSRCIQCGGNSFAPQGAAECIPCPIGQVFINSTQSCEPDCEPGFFYDESALECLPCAVNQFSRGRGLGFCNPCLFGSFARVGSSTCFLCPPGQSFIEAIDGCGVCPEDAPYSMLTASCGSGSTVLITPLPEASDEA